MKNKFSMAISLAVIFAMVITSLALADDVLPDGDIVNAGNQPSVNLGTVAPGATLTPKVSFTLACSGNKHVDNGQTAAMTYSTSGSNAPAGGSIVSVTTASIGAVPSAWIDDGTNCPTTPPTPLVDNGDSTVTLTAPTAPGTYTYKINYEVALSPAGNQDSSSVTGSTFVQFTLTVAVVKTTPTITWNNPANIVYGTALSGTQLNATASVPGTFTYTPAAGTILNASAGQTLHVDFVPDNTTLYNNTSKDVTINVLPADATCSVSGYTGVYDAASHGATGSCSGIGGESAGTLDLGASFKNVPGGTASWTFTGNGNYKDQSGTANIVISKADATCSVSGYTGVYDAASHSATGSCSGVGGESAGTLNLGASFKDVPGGTAHWAFTGNGNYNDQSGDVGIDISKADAACSVSGYTGVYDAASHGATGSCSGIGGESAGTLDLGVSFKDVPGGTAHWAFTGNGNYNDQNGNAAIDISKADATCSVNGYTGVYDAAAHGASGSCTGVDAGGAALSSSLDLGASFTNVPGGTAHWTFDGGKNYLDEHGDAAIVISKAMLTVTADTQSKLLNAPNPAFTFAYSGFKGNDGAGNIDTEPTCSSVAANSPVGSYAINCSGGSDNNYDFSYVTGTFKITYATGGMCLGGPGHSILQPINSDGSSNFKQKSTIPVKFRVCDAYGNSIGTPGVVSSFIMVKVTSGTADQPLEDIVSTTPDTAFRWSSTDQQWIFNLNTKNLSASRTYFYRINLNDGTWIDFYFGLK